MSMEEKMAELLELSRKNNEFLKRCLLFLKLIEQEQIIEKDVCTVVYLIDEQLKCVKTNNDFLEHFFEFGK